jgi:UDP-N-acetylglucosamine enolpyruvyl transferase
VILSVATPILTPATPPDDPAQGATATAALASGSLSVTFTEAQLTEMVRPGLERGTGDLTFSGTQVSLRGGQMTIAATASVSGLSAPATLVLTGAVANGEIVFTATSAALGPFDFPADSLKALSASINTAVNASLRQEAPNVRPTALTIADGTLAITGEILAP